MGKGGNGIDWKRGEKLRSEKGGSHREIGRASAQTHIALEPLGRAEILHRQPEGRRLLRLGEGVVNRREDEHFPL